MASKDCPALTRIVHLIRLMADILRSTLRLCRLIPHLPPTGLAMVRRYMESLEWPAKVAVVGICCHSQDLAHRNRISSGPRISTLIPSFVLQEEVSISVRVARILNALFGTASTLGLKACTYDPGGSHQHALRSSVSDRISIRHIFWYFVERLVRATSLDARRSGPGTHSGNCCQPLRNELLCPSRQDDKVDRYLS